MELTEREKELVSAALQDDNGEVVVNGTDYEGKQSAQSLIRHGIFQHVRSYMSETYKITLIGRMYFEDKL